MSIKVNVKMTAEYMYDFSIYHNYTHASGILGVVVGMLGVASAVNSIIQGNPQAASVGLIVALLFLVVTPYNMKTRSKQQVKNTPMFQKPLEYEFTEEGITVRQDEMEAASKWEEYTKVVSTKKSVIIYLSRVRALIFPKECLGSQYDEVLQVIREHVPAKRIKIK